MQITKSYLQNKKIYVTDKQFKEEDWVCYNWCHLLEESRLPVCIIENILKYSTQQQSTQSKIFQQTKTFIPLLSVVCDIVMTFKASEMPTNASYFITSFIGKMCVGWLVGCWMNGNNWQLLVKFRSIIEMKIITFIDSSCYNILL